MQVIKRDGSRQTINLKKIRTSIERVTEDLKSVDVDLLINTTTRGLYDGVSSRELDAVSIKVAASMIMTDPEYDTVASRLTRKIIEKEVGDRRLGDSDLYDVHTVAFILEHRKALEKIMWEHPVGDLTYMSIDTLQQRYLLRENDKLIETPEMMFMRIACGLANTLDEATEWYRMYSSLSFLPSSPTLFNSGLKTPQLSSCYILDSPEDSLDSIYKSYTDIAKLSKYAGGIGLNYSRIRSNRSKIKGTNGKTNGIIPFLKVLDSSTACIDQGSKRKGATAVYLETWHADILDFLELRDNTGDIERRGYHLNFANWIPDIFMRRVEADESWSLFSPSDTPNLSDLYGDDFNVAYEEYENRGLAREVLPARELYAKMMHALATTGNGWMCFKDTSNRLSNVTGEPGRVIHSSNLCTEILEVQNKDEVAVCNLASVNLAKCIVEGAFSYSRLEVIVDSMIRHLDRTIDRGIYRIPEAEKSNKYWRNIGAGRMGFQDVLYMLGIPYESDVAKNISTSIAETIYYQACKTSIALAREYGPAPGWRETRIAKGLKVLPWEPVTHKAIKHGMRNSLLVAIAPNATIGILAGVTEAMEPQLANVFKRKTIAGEFPHINRYLVKALKDEGLWSEDMRDTIILADGSVQDIPTIPQGIKDTYKTAWEISQKTIIGMVAEATPYIDQGQSMNLFIENPTIGKLSSMYMHVWKSGVKTSYYLRSRSKTKTRKTFNMTADAQVSCSLENPDSCEACQ